MTDTLRPIRILVLGRRLSRVIRYEGKLYRPPSEADSLILQATIGCSYNRCTFCAMYRDKRFRVRPIEELAREIEWAAQQLGPVRKVFLADGDALMAKSSYLAALLDELRSAFGPLARVSCYASPQSLQVRSVEEMRELRERGLSLYYLGIESGHDEVLRRLVKGVDAAEMIRVAAKATEAGVALSTMILLGAGGPALSLEHARESARVVNAIQPRFLSTLIMTPVAGTPLLEEERRGEYERVSDRQATRELRELVSGLELRGTIFRSNHASNAVPLEGTLPRDKQRLLDALDAMLELGDGAPFVPRWARGL